MNGHIDAIVSAIKTWAFGAAALTTVLAFMPFAATMIFLSPFYDLSPIKVNLILCSEKNEKEAEDDNEEQSDDEDDEANEEEQSDDEKSVSIEADSEVSVEVEQYPTMNEKRATYLSEFERDAEEARKNGDNEKAQQLEDVAGILRTLWDVPKNGSPEKAQTPEDVARILRSIWDSPKSATDTTSLREAPPLPNEDAEKNKDA